MQYPIEKPTTPFTTRALVVAVLLGLTGLGLVAYEVFRMIDTPAVAAAFALVIELGAISEALSIIKRNRPAIAGLVVSLLVSGFYNFTRAAQASERLTLALSLPELIALALGPLSATLFLALALGHALREYEAAVGQWQQDAAAWTAEQERAKEEAEARREAREQARAMELEALRLAHEEKLERARLRAEAKARTSSQQARTSIEVPGSVVEVPRGSYSDFVEVLRANGREWKNAELAEKLGVTTRTITKWRAQYQAETEGAPVINSN